MLHLMKASAAARALLIGCGDAGAPSSTGAGFDGLEPGGRNENRGAESTLAALGTAQHARELGILPAGSSRW